MKKAIVIGCRSIGLGVIRSLSSENVTVMAIPTGLYDFAHYSRYVAARSKKIFPEGEHAGLLQYLLHLDREWDGALIVSTTDFSAHLVAQNRDLLGSRYIPATQDVYIIRSFLDKSILYKRAQQIGIPLPRICFPESIAALAQMKEDLTFPCILKPHDSAQFFSVFQAKVLIVSCFDELIDKFGKVLAHNLQVMISEIIPGADDQIYDYSSYSDSRGSIVAEVCIQKLRQHPPGFGMATAARTVPMIVQVRDYARKLLKRFSYRGYSSAEFKFDQRDGQYKLMEINVRYTLQERLCLASGVNFPLITFQDYAGGASMASSGYISGIYWIDLFNDLYEFFRPGRSGRCSFCDYVRPYLKKKVFATPLVDDPAPFLARCLILVREHLKGLSLKIGKMIKSRGKK